MAGPVYISQADLEDHYTPTVVTNLFDDSGAGTPGPRLNRACAIASRQGDAILLKGWSPEQIATLVHEDEAVLAALCKLAMAVGGEGKPEWTGEGAPFQTAAKDARAELELLAKAHLRSRAESAGAGENPNRRGSVSHGTPQFLFAPSRSKPNPGGF